MKMARQAFSAMIDYYATLKVQPTATTDQIRSSYKKLSLKYHPDKTGGDQKATKHFLAIKNAYDILTDQTIRAQYDQARQQRARTTGSSRSGRTATSGFSNPQPPRDTSPNSYAEAYERDRAREEYHKRARAREEERRRDEAREGERRRDEAREGERKREEAQENERKRKRDFEQAKYEREQDEARTWVYTKREQAECRMREDVRHAKERARGARRDREREQAFQAAEAGRESAMFDRNATKRHRERGETNSKLWADSTNRASREQREHAYSDFFKAGRAQGGPSLNEQYNVYGQMRGHGTFGQPNPQTSYGQAPPNPTESQSDCSTSSCNAQTQQDDSMPEFELTGPAIERKIINVVGVHTWETCTGTQKARFDEGDLAREMAIKRGMLTNDGGITTLKSRGPKKTTNARPLKRPAPASETGNNTNTTPDSPPAQPSPFTYVFGSGGQGRMQGSAMFGKTGFSGLKVDGKENQSQRPHLEGSETRVGSRQRLVGHLGQRSISRQTTSTTGRARRRSLICEDWDWGLGGHWVRVWV